MQGRLRKNGSEALMRLDLTLGEDSAQLASHYQQTQNHLPLEPAMRLRPVVTVSI